MLGVMLAPFWDPPGLKKQGFRVEGVAFFEKSRGSKQAPKLEQFTSRNEPQEQRYPAGVQARGEGI